LPLLRTHSARLLMCLLPVLPAMLAATPCAAQQEESAEVGIKAAFLYNFTQYIEWPAETFSRPEAPLVIGILASDRMAAELGRATRGRKVNDRPIEVRRVREGEPATGLHMLFIGNDASGRIEQLVRATPGPVLIVTESEGALDRGSVLNFVVADGRVRFEAALGPAQRRGLRISSRMLAVAINVRAGADHEKRHIATVQRLLPRSPRG
jgi:hypothetical protein